MKKFDGFSPGKHKITAIPSTFISDLLPMIDDLAELKVTLFCFWALQQKEGEFRYITHDEFANNNELIASLTSARPDDDPLTTLDDALERAVQRNSLLHASVDLDHGKHALYFMNTERGRAAISQIKAGQWKQGWDENPVEILPERPNVFRLYEENIGPLAPMIIDELKDAEKTYPEDWIREAIKDAVENNVRKWRYIRAILERWKQEGRQDEVSRRHSLEDGKRYVTGKYADWIES